jgi:protein-disulfide isomerase
MPHIIARNIVARSLAAAACLFAVTLWSTSAEAQRMPVPWKKSAAEQVEIVRGAESPDIGSPDAPVTIVAFSDYRCPYCRQLSANLQRLLEEHPDRIRVTYRHLALTPESRTMSQAALCAGDQGRFADYHHLVFGTTGVTVDALPRLAEQLGLDRAAFRECTTTNRHAARIDQDIREGERLDIQMTPTFFINGKRIVGSPAMEKLRDRIAELVTTAALRN